MAPLWEGKRGLKEFAADLQLIGGSRMAKDIIAD